MTVEATLVTGEGRGSFQENLDKALEDSQTCMMYHDCIHTIVDIKFAADEDGYHALVISDCPGGTEERTYTISKADPA